MNRSAMTAALLGGALALGGCGDEGSPVSQRAAFAEIDACALLTAAEIEEATGIAPGAPEATGGGNRPPMCDWPSKDDAYPFAAGLMVAPSDNYTSYDDAMAKWRETSEEMGMEFNFDEYEEVDGPGTVNTWLREVGMLQAHRGDRMVQIYLHDVAPDRDRQQAAIALARHAVARLD